MKERPILFNGPMVRGVLSGQKTVTRRLLKMPHGFWETSATGELVPIPVNCPYGKPGDWLWVRETCFINDYREASVPEQERADCEIHYRADGIPDFEGEEELIRWRPSIHMPRWASRILLEVTDVRVERLRDTADLALLDELGDMLDDCDSVAGKEFSRIEHLQSAGAPLSMLPEMYGFKAYWDKVNGAGSFDANPWVWVVEFKRTSPK